MEFRCYYPWRCLIIIHSSLIGRRNENKMEDVDTVVATLVYSDKEDRMYCLEENNQCEEDRCGGGHDVGNKNGNPASKDTTAGDSDSSTRSSHMNPGREHPRGLPCMTSAVAGGMGVPKKSRQKE